MFNDICCNECGSPWTKLWPTSPVGGGNDEERGTFVKSGTGRPRSWVFLVPGSTTVGLYTEGILGTGGVESYSGTGEPEEGVSCDISDESVEFIRRGCLGCVPL